MATIDKSKFQFVKRDDFASETIDAPAYSYWRSVMRQFLKKKFLTSTSLKTLWCRWYLVSRLQLSELLLVQP